MDPALLWIGHLNRAYRQAATEQRALLCGSRASSYDSGGCHTLSFHCGAAAAVEELYPWLREVGSWSPQELKEWAWRDAAREFNVEVAA